MRVLLEAMVRSSEKAEQNEEKKIILIINKEGVWLLEVKLKFIWYGYIRFLYANYMNHKHAE